MSELLRDCPKCGTTKPLSGFHRAKRFRLGRQYVCKVCQAAHNKLIRQKDPARARAIAKRSRERNPERTRAHKRRAILKCVYGLTPEQYDAMLSAQDGACAICRGTDPRRRLSIDHNHQTKAVRGLLCDQCNMGLGKFKDDSKLLRAAATYVEARS